MNHRNRLSCRYWLSLCGGLSLFFTPLLLAGCQAQPDTAEAPQATPTASSKIAAAWVNNGEDKVTRDQRRVSQQAIDVRNSVWDGQKVALFAAKNETVAFNLVLEAGDSEATELEVKLISLQHSEGAEITSRKAAAGDLFDFRDRNIELFFVRYLKIEGLSKIAYETYDERHIPTRLRRPIGSQGAAKGTWEDRPAHDKLYPDIAGPLELHSPFSIPAESSQSIWTDIYVPREAPPGLYRGELVVSEQDDVTWKIPIELTVHDFTLPELPHAKTMLFVSEENINKRYLGEAYPRDARSAALVRSSEKLMDRHYQMAHRHKLSVIENHRPLELMSPGVIRRLSGELFTAKYGYEGVGAGVGNNVFSIGTYGGWPWKNGTKQDMWRETDRWVKWFEQQQFETPTHRFLYLIDESPDYETTQKWAAWVEENPGPGSQLDTLATLPAPESVEQTPSLDVTTSLFHVGLPQTWQAAVQEIQHDPQRHWFLYNGMRPASGSFVIEDEGVALRQIAWAQYKLQAERWFYWESTYYNNYQAGTGETNVFQQARTFGAPGKGDTVLGATGWNHGNGDGVLFYPGTDTEFPEESYGVSGPLASLRLKHWRRGIQDVDYLTMAAEIDQQRVEEIVQQIIPRTLWEIGVTDANDPTWVQTDIAWSINPDDWERARKELAEIIASGKEK